ncbi:glycosyl-4,4'-diaponeurosporenoate acyltransferase CrtO family protein [Corynebacterium hadale]
MVALLLTLAAVFGLSAVAGATGAGAAGFVISATLLGFGLAPFVGDSLQRLLPCSVWGRFSLSAGVSRRLGVDQFNAFLTRVGWNRQVLAMRGSGAGGRRNPRHMQAAAAGHAWALVLHVVAAVWAALAAGWVAAVVLLVVGVVGHLYPVLLQVRVLTLLREATTGGRRTT